MTSPSHEQLETLLSFLEEHNDLARGLLRSVEGRLQSQRLWGEICSTLNSMGGCTKSIQQWQRVSAVMSIYHNIFLPFLKCKFN